MMDVLNVDILNEIFKDGDINGALRWGFTNKRNIEILHKTKIYKDWYILGSNKIVVDYKMHYELFKFYIEDLIVKIRKEYNEKESDYNPVILNKKLHPRISYMIRLCLSCNNFDMFKYFIDNVEKYISSCGDSLLYVISKILCKYCNDMRYFKKVYSSRCLLSDMVNDDMVKYCECSETFDKYQIEFNNPIVFTKDDPYNLCSHLNTTILKHILNTYPDNTVDGTIDNIVEYFRSYTNNWVNHGNTKFILTLIETINNNDKLKNRYINDLFLHACGYKNIKYIEDVYDADLIDKKTIIEGIRNSIVQNNSVFEIWALFDGCLNIEDIGNVLRISIVHSRKKIARYIKNKYYDGLINYYDNIDDEKIEELISLNSNWIYNNISTNNHNDIIHLTIEMFNENKIYPLLLKNYSNYLTKYSKKIIRKLLSYVNFTDDNKNKHFALLKLFVLNDQFYILTKYEKYKCEQSKKNHMFIDLVVFMKDYKIDMDKIVMICKMIQ